ncbi:tRNA (adenosine(37)-N6)-threonylcarbamoyltransferase complex dimerization subunit type 1 TsaB [Pseudoduganella sp. RAF53_2]|uniref:tRNA (adenosine(37)-N6)-threonylcarbamoyltransferase complex dimerization subunit type 1 TsaB n=1 Tax=unclassified Pseudoduganella TaxID=2637179 RepID=UPI003F948F13
MPIILAIETSSEMASCALLRGGEVIFRESSGVRTHSQSVLPMVQELLDEAGIALRDCDAIAYGAGPGSFTGVRTACGISQGLGFGAELPLVPVVTLDAMALACRQAHGADAVLAVLDARMNEVYWAQYRFDGDAPVATLEPALSAPQDVVPAPGALAAAPVAASTGAAASAPSGSAASALAACGNGFSAYPDAFAGKPFAAGAYANIMPHAVQIAQLGARLFEAGHAVPAAQAQPLYLRNKVAYTKEERAEMKASQA